jgi:hypothetical protein
MTVRDVISIGRGVPASSAYGQIQGSDVVDHSFQSPEAANTHK